MSPLPVILRATSLCPHQDSSNSPSQQNALFILLPLRSYGTVFIGAVVTVHLIMFLLFLFGWWIPGGQELSLFDCCSLSTQQSTWHIVDTREMAGVAVIETGSYRILFSSSSGVERYRNFTCAYKRERNREMVLWYPFCVTQCAQGFMPITRKLNLQTLWSLMKTALLFCI